MMIARWVNVQIDKDKTKEGHRVFIIPPGYDTPKTNWLNYGGWQYQWDRFWYGPMWAKFRWRIREGRSSPFGLGLKASFRRYFHRPRLPAFWTDR